MTLRQRYAGMALQGLLANPHIMEKFREASLVLKLPDETRLVIRAALVLADAMIEEEKTK